MGTAAVLGSSQLGSATSHSEPDWRHGGSSHVHSTAPDVDPLRDANAFVPQAVLARAGACMLVLGLLMVAGGVYAVAVHADGHDQAVWLMAGGFGGLVTAVVGGFLYAGSWIAELVEDTHAVQRQMAVTMLALADVTAQATAASAHVGAIAVTVGDDGTVVHRRDCPLVAYRPDLIPADPARSHLSKCRVCTP